MTNYHPSTDRIFLSQLDNHILLALAQKPTNGYSIARQCEIDTQAEYGAQSNGSLYRALKRLKLINLIEVSPASERTYKLTPIGYSHLEATLEAYHHFITLAEARNVKYQAQTATKQASADDILQLYS